MRIALALLGASLGALPGLAVPLRAAGPVIVHEWGTFTSLQDENGKAIGGINVDDEPVPHFVYQYAHNIYATELVAAQYSQDEWNFGLPPYGDGGKGLVPGDPSVTMRLETPVIYIYPPKGRTPQSVPLLDVHVDFHGGVLSQYYPYAQTNGTALLDGFTYLKDKGITETMTTGLTWKGVQLGVSGKLIGTEDELLKNVPSERGQPVVTDDKVWTTPREVSAPLLGVKHNQGGHQIVEAEHFLFYRGVGHLDSPIRVVPSGSNQTGKMDITSRETNHSRKPNAIDQVAVDSGWMVEIRQDGTCAYRPKDNPPDSGTEDLGVVFLGNVRATFTKSDFSAGNLAKLKASMQDALIKEGLYPDEATAMLHTWELSYFKSPGLRFFYIVPREWVDKVLPLKITGAPTQVTRVMIGRIELITDAQRAALARLAAGPCPDLATVKQAALDALQNGKLSQEEKSAFYSGEKPLSALGIAIPPLVQDYLSLGRFRDALIVHEQQQHPSATLARFIRENHLVPGVN